MDGKGYIVSASPLAGEGVRRMEKKEGNDVNLEFTMEPTRIETTRADIKIMATKSNNSIDLFKGTECIGWIHITEEGKTHLTLYAIHFDNINIYPK